MKKLIFLFLAALLLTACGTPKYISKPKNFKYRVHGLVVDAITYDQGRIMGEIIQVDSSEVILLSVRKDKGKILSLSKDQIKYGKILVSASYDEDASLNTWASLLTIGSLAHGYYGILSVPFNIGVGLGPGGSSYYIRYPDGIKWEEISKFARFPQGIPEGITLSQIR